MGRGRTRASTGWGDWEERNRYHRNRLGAGALYTYHRPTSVSVEEESDTGRSPAIFVFPILRISFWAPRGGVNTKTPVQSENTSTGPFKSA